MKFFSQQLLLLTLLTSGFHLRATTTVHPDSKTLFEVATKTTKQNNLLNIALNTRLSFHTLLSGADKEQSAFRLDYLRMQVEGDITDRIYYKWMQHLNRSNKSGKLDNMPSSIDCLGVGFRLTPSLSVFAGKQYADFGGFEYDANPAEIYEYSDMGEYITCFLVGVNLSWWFTPSQEIRFQIVDGHSESAEDTYGTLPSGIKSAKAPLGYTLNWNGDFLNKRLFTRCSFSLFHEGQKQNVYFLALAAAWVQDNFNLYIDALYSAEDIDKLGLLSESTARVENPVRATHSGYFSLVSRINYRVLPKWNLFVKGMYETTAARKNTPLQEKGKYRTSYGYQGGIEYFPQKENLHFFAMYRGRQIHYTDRAKILGNENENPQRISLGFIYKIPIY
ncbi:MAG: porin [Odoribacter sp.]